MRSSILFGLYRWSMTRPKYLPMFATRGGLVPAMASCIWRFRRRNPLLWLPHFWAGLFPPTPSRADTSTTSTPLAKSLMPTAWPKGITVFSWAYAHCTQAVLPYAAQGTCFWFHTCSHPSLFHFSCRRRHALLCAE